MILKQLQALSFFLVVVAKIVENVEVESTSILSLDNLVLTLTVQVNYVELSGIETDPEQGIFSLPRAESIQPCPSVCLSVYIRTSPSVLEIAV